MSEWRLFSGSSSSWNNLVSNFDNSTICMEMNGQSI